MPYSSGEGKVQGAGFVSDLNPATVIDVGAGAGGWRQVLCGLWPQARWTALEVWEPYVARFDLPSMYGRVVVADGLTVDLAELEPSYDLAIFGDVIEHLTRPDAVAMMKRLPWQHALVSLPIVEYPQGAWEGNPFEAHLATWDADMAHAAFSDFATVEREWFGVEIGVFLLRRH